MYVLFGRDAHQEQLAGSPGPLVVVCGDSGVGKSALLTAGQRQAEGVAPAPVAVMSSPGSLQRALLETITAGIKEVETEDGLLGRVERLALAAAERMARQGLADVAHAVGVVIRHQAVKHLGEEAVALAERARDALVESQGEELRRRVAEGVDPDVAVVVLGFAAELGAMAGAPVSLALDDVHKLDGDDHRRLLDLGATAPEGVMVRAGFTVTPETSGRLLELRASGASVVEVGPLDAGDVSAWASEEGFDEKAAAQVMAATGGVAFHVRDALALLGWFDGEGFDLGRLAHDDVVRVRTDQAWGALDDQPRLAASLLAPLTDEISADRAAQILQIDVGVWFVLRDRLVEAGLFLRDSGWFHELRRRCLLDDVLTADQVAAARRTLAERAVEMLDQRPDSEIDVRGCIRDLGAMPWAALEVLGDRDGVAEVAACSLDELRTLVAVIELSERPSPDIVAGEVGVVRAQIVVHHLASLGSPVDAVATLPRLRDAGLVGVAEGGDQVGVWPRFPSPAASWLIQGRSAVELDRWPVRGVAAAIFDVALRPVLGTFHAVQRGVGPTTLAELAGNANQLQRQPRKGTVVHSDRLPSLVVRGRFAGDVPFSAAVAFDRFAEREAAIAGLRGQDAIEIIGSPFTIEEVYAVPGRPLPLNRFAAAYKDAAGMSAAELLQQHVKLPEVVRRIKAFHDVVRRNTSSLEQDILGVVDPLGMRYASDGDRYLFVHVLGDDTVAELGPEQVAWPATPQEWLAFDQRLGLGLGQRHGRMHGGGGGFRGDPLSGMLDSLSRSAKAYNGAQLRLEIDYTIEALAPLLAEGFAAHNALVAEIAAEVFGKDHTPLTVHALLDITEPTGNWVPGAMDRLMWWASPAGAGGPELHIRAGAYDGAWFGEGPDADWFAATFDCDPPRIKGAGVTTCWDWIAETLGYDHTHVWLHFPGQQRLPRPEDDIF